MGGEAGFTGETPKRRNRYTPLSTTVEPIIYVVDLYGEIVYRRVGNFSSELTRSELLAAIEQARG